MTYDPTSFYGLPYDHRTMSTMGVTGYEHSMDPYFGQSGTSMSRARNPVEVRYNDNDERIEEVN